MSKKWITAIGIVVGGTFLIACEKMLPQAPPEDGLLDGPAGGLNTEEHMQFLRGDIAFNDDIFTNETGLGPVFVAISCGTCHAGDGKGHPFTALIRFGQSDTLGNRFLNQGGPQLQHHAIPGFKPETIPAEASFSKLLPPGVTWLGFLDAVPDTTILALADPNDADGDGISGRPNWIQAPDYCIPRPGTIERNGKYLGRIGKKAAVNDLLQKTAVAYNKDIEIGRSTYRERESKCE